MINSLHRLRLIASYRILKNDLDLKSPIHRIIANALDFDTIILIFLCDHTTQRIADIAHTIMHRSNLDDCLICADLMR